MGALADAIGWLIGTTVALALQGAWLTLMLCRRYRWIEPQ